MIDKAQELIQSQQHQEFESLLNEHPELSDQLTAQGISLMTFAAYCRNQTAVDLLKKRKKGLTFFEAIIIGDEEQTVECLGKDAEKINEFSVDGFTGLGLACFFGHFKMAKILTRAGANINQSSNNQFKVYPIHSACAISDFEIVEFLIAHGANVNVQQQSGVSPLHSAAHNGNISIVKLLIENKADRSARMTTGQTAIDMAKEKNHTEVVEYLEALNF